MLEGVVAVDPDEARAYDRLAKSFAALGRVGEAEASRALHERLSKVPATRAKEAFRRDNPWAATVLERVAPVVPAGPGETVPQGR